MDWVHAYYISYFVFHVTFCTLKHGERMEISVGSALLLPLLHLPVLGRVFGWW